MLQGELSTFPLTDLLLWLTSTRRTGQLGLAQGPGCAHSTAPSRYLEIYLSEGGICGAFAGGGGVATEGQQIRALLTNALAWQRGRFTFTANEMPSWAQTVTRQFAAEPLLRAAQSMLETKQPLKPEPQFDRAPHQEVRSDTLTLAENLRLYAMSRILKGDFTVPALPDLAVRVLELTSNENFSLRTLGELVIKDQAVAAQVLRFANSPINGYTYRVDSLDQAVQRLGAGKVVNIVLAVALQAQRLQNDRFATEKNLLWKHPSAAAFIASTLAEKTQLKSSLAFTCGLLMDFGTTVLYAIFQDLLERRTIRHSIPPQVIASVVWEYHPRLGRVVGERWRLPQTVIESIAHHHSLEENYCDDPYVALIALADYLATLAIHTPRIDLQPVLARFSPDLLVKHPAGKLIGLNAEQAVEVLQEIPQNLRQAQEFVLN
jgi:HD-like signal output (HDOD) protein